MKGVLVLVGSEPFPSQLDHFGVVYPDEVVDQKSDEVGNSNVRPEPGTLDVLQPIIQGQF